MVELTLSAGDRAMLSGERGEAPRLAMRLVVGMARSVRAERLIDVTSAHVDGCLYHGQVASTSPPVWSRPGPGWRCPPR